MTEREARGLAAELDSHKWWQVERVYPGEGLWSSDWLIRLRHRVHPGARMVVHAPTETLLVDRLMTLGALWAERTPDPPFTLYQ